MAPKQGKSAQNSAASASQAASKNAKGAKKKKWSKGKVRCLSHLFVFSVTAVVVPADVVGRSGEGGSCRHFPCESVRLF